MGVFKAASIVIEGVRARLIAGRHEPITASTSGGKLPSDAVIG